jgi:hypothetical protein
MIELRREAIGSKNFIVILLKVWFGAPMHFMGTLHGLVVNIRLLARECLLWQKNHGISKSFYIQYLILVVTWCTDSIFVQVWIPWFKNHEDDCLQFCKPWSLSAFRVISEKKRHCLGKDLKHRYGVHGHVHKSQHMVRFRGSSAICMLSCD